MTSIRAPFDSPAHFADAAANPPWDRLYNALLNQLTSYIDLAVAQALEAHGLTTPRLARSSTPTVQPRREAQARHPAPPVTRPAGPDPVDRQPMSGPVPPWLEPFGLPDNVRFTRTPDLYLRPERAPAEAAAFEDTEDLSPNDPDGFDPDLPAWRRPFTLPPNVRINRTPERRLAAGPTGLTVTEVPEPKPAAAIVPADPLVEALSWFGIAPAEPQQPSPAAPKSQAPDPVVAVEPSHEVSSDDLNAQAWAMLSHPGSATDETGRDPMTAEHDDRATVEPGEF